MNLRKHSARYAQQFQDLIIPIQAGKIHQQRSGGIRHIGDVHAARQIPDDPRVDVAEEQLAFLGSSSRSGDMIEDPFDLWP